MIAQRYVQTQSRDPLESQKIESRTFDQHDVGVVA
jgi:hypothetical protein